VASQLQMTAHLAVGARERAALVTEDQRLHQGPRNRRAVDGDEGMIAAAAHLVQSARDPLFAGTGFAADQHRSIGVGDSLDQLPYAGHRRGRADQRADAKGLVDLLPQSQHLSA
jgi:hypothetical protein